jgi:hypothetical protein
MQLQLTISLPGPNVFPEFAANVLGWPIAYATAAADALGWAHLICDSSCRCTGVGPSHMRLQLPMHCGGPIAYVTATADELEWPIAYSTAADDGFAWAHYFSGSCCRCSRMGPSCTHLQLPMASLGPISFLGGAADALR